MNSLLRKEILKLLHSMDFALLASSHLRTTHEHIPFVLCLLKSPCFMIILHFSCTLLTFNHYYYLFIFLDKSFNHYYCHHQQLM